MRKTKQQSLYLEITDEMRVEAEQQILENIKVVDFDTVEYPVEVLVSKYVVGLDQDENELFVPDYQRDFVWDVKRQSKFIESVIIGLPIPYFFVADVSSKEGRLEIVDGSQRIRTLAAFLADELELTGLEKLTKLNGFRFSKLPLVRQRRVRGRSLRTIKLTEKAVEEVRRDIFERINTGSFVLNDMEVRRGIKPGPFLDFITECAQNQTFRRLAPLSETSERRYERHEFVLRFFAYFDAYREFDRSVVEFLNWYLNRKQTRFRPEDRERMLDTWESMLTFVDRHFPNGFSKKTGHTRTPRIRFEALSVGTALALQENPNLTIADVKWIDSEEFRLYTTSDASNSRPKLIRRIEFVRDNLLGRL